MFRTLMSCVVVGLAGVGVAHGETLTIQDGVPNYLNLVDDAALRAEGLSPDGITPWADGNIGNATGYGSHRMYPDTGAASGRGPRRYLTRFDVSSIPTNATIISATMSVFYQRSGSNAEAITDFKLSRLQAGKAWTEGVGQYPATDGSVTWNSQISYAAGNPARVPWATPGATGAADIDLATTITFNKSGPGISEWKDFNITSWVQAWVNGTWQNNGMVFWGGVGAGVDAYYGIVGSETTDVTGNPRPKLVVVYCPPGTSACASAVVPAGNQNVTGFTQGLAYPYATIDLGYTDVPTNLTHPRGEDGVTMPTVVGLRECRRNYNPTSDPYMYFNVADGLIFEGNVPEVTISFDYYDVGGGAFSLNYDGTTSEWSTAPTTVPVGETGTWKRGSFTITDAYFGGREHMDADFRIARGNSIPFYLDNVSVSYAIPDITYTISNPGCTTINWTATEVDVYGAPTDHAWLSLSPGSGSLGSGLAAPVTASIDATGLTTPGLYPAYIKFSDGCPATPVSCLNEPFTYANGALNGNGGWTGTATASDIAVDTNTVKYTGGSAFAYVLRDINCGNPADSLITVSMKVKAGGGVSTLWIADIADSSGNSFGRFYGTGTTARGRIGDLGLVTGVSNLTGPGTWDTLTMEIYPATNKTMFYFNGVLMTDGILDHTASGAGDQVARAGLGRVQNSNSATDYAFLDDLTVSVEPITLRQIDLTVVGCSASVQPPNGSGGLVVSGSGGTTTRYFTVTNNGAYAISDLAVTEIANSSPYGPNDYPWLTLSYPSDPIPPGGTAVVTATINLDDTNLVTGTAAQASLNFYFCGGNNYNVPVLTVTRLLPVIHKYEMCEDVALAQTNGSPAMDLTASGYGDDDTADPGYSKIGQGDDPNAVSARFVDTTNMTGEHGLSLRGLGATTGASGFTVDMRIWGEEETAGTLGGWGYSASIANNWDQGRRIAIEPTSPTSTDDSLSLTFLHSGVAAGPFTVPDNPDNSTRFHKIRIVVYNSIGGTQAEERILVYDLENDLDPGEGVLWNLVGACTDLGGTHNVPGGTAGGLALNSLAGSETSNSKWSADWIRIDANNALGATDPIIEGAECDGGLFADVDDDGDVDHADFAAFQLCYTGDAGGVPTGCKRFNRDGDENGTVPGGDIDGFDREAFEDCASGAGVPADVCCDGQPKPGCP